MTKAQYEKLQQARLILKTLDEFLQAEPDEEESLSIAVELDMPELESDLECELLGWNHVSEYLTLLSTELERYHASISAFYDIAESLEHYIDLIIAHDDMEKNPIVQKYRESLKLLS